MLEFLHCWSRNTVVKHITVVNDRENLGTDKLFQLVDGEELLDRIKFPDHQKTNLDNFFHLQLESEA